GVLGDGGIAASANFTLVGCGDQGVFAIVDGQAIAVPPLAGVAPSAMTVAPDGTVYYFDTVTRTIWRITDVTRTSELDAAVDSPDVTALSVDTARYLYWLEHLGSDTGRVMRTVPTNKRTTIIAGTLAPDPGGAQQGSARNLA